jgi:hypothetical protein
MLLCGYVLGAWMAHFGHSTAPVRLNSQAGHCKRYQLLVAQQRSQQLALPRYACT